jgi:DNA-binding NtrC family response regulator
MIHRRILVVDDVKDWREQLQSILKRNGYKVDTAQNYREALDKIDRNPAELVIVDLRLDPVDEDNREGIQLLEMLAYKRINALVITGYGTSQLKQKAETLDVIGFLEKSVIGRSLEKLKTVVNKIFSEIEERDHNQAELARKFGQGEAVDFPANAVGYPLRESLKHLIEKVLDGP